ncbi:secondary thiamine-phosphate synthase enzyme YjbQ [Hyphomicrobium sp.]|uniref:secondary thiamine-phosphate synthase enzyme YjbQ n=1 Tax=Hyphomicrobium sp. TaxID=82 RepID=UPI002D787222|nr:secondary thiamine-phosphate synthase enzyme YjbQ [Hyphomicrobium sp.]HET6388209.1 secondary thiamine-phosphate synthase enzyme YjbQ [Hyphomicrobium sp.]
MRHYQETLGIDTRGTSLVELTGQVARIVRTAGIETGMAHVFCRHTSASLLIQENADPDVQRDLVAFFKRLVPDGDPLFVHQSEGPDDMPAHVKSALTQTTLSIPVGDFQMMLGTWQGIYLFEHRRRPHTRQIVVHVVGE